MRVINMLLAIVRGRAIVLVRHDKQADVMIGKNISKQFAVNSMVGAVKTLMQV